MYLQTPSARNQGAESRMLTTLGGIGTGSSMEVTRMWKWGVGHVDILFIHELRCLLRLVIIEHGPGPECGAIKIRGLGDWRIHEGTGAGCGKVGEDGTTAGTGTRAGVCLPGGVGDGTREHVFEVHHGYLGVFGEFGSNRIRRVMCNRVSVVKGWIVK
jgi:hypothetical protein